MIIHRTIDGFDHAIELSLQEMTNAYYEQQHNFDLEDVLEELYLSEDDEFFEDVYECTVQELEQRADDVAYLMRKYIDKYEMGWYDAREDAISEVAKRIAEENKTKEETS